MTRLCSFLLLLIGSCEFQSLRNERALDSRLFSFLPLRLRGELPYQSQLDVLNHDFLNLHMNETHTRFESTVARTQLQDTQIRDLVENITELSARANAENDVADVFILYY